MPCMRMNRNHFVAVLMMAILVALASAWPAVCIGGGTTPITDHGRPWRIAYFDGGPCTDYGD